MHPPEKRILNEVVVLTNHNSIQNPFVVVDANQNILKRQRGSAPSIDMNPSTDFQKGAIMDEGYAHVSNSLRSSARGVHFNSTMNTKITDSRRGRVVKPQRAFYSQSPSPMRLPDGSSRNQNYKNASMKFHGQKPAKVVSLPRRAIKVGSKNKKFPKDFF